MQHDSRGENRRGTVAAVVRAAIYPPIGIARVGNSEDDYFVGPEIPYPSAAVPGFYRDCRGALKRQAARFRIYGLDARGQAITEFTVQNSEIRWTVHLANRKAAWYQFQIAHDIPEAAYAQPSFLRNVHIADRAALSIDPGPKSIFGGGQSGNRYLFEGGRFMGKEVYLGELRTDTQGRLIVLGGHGCAASYDQSRVLTFANNEGWHDDISDGPVTATVTAEGRAIEVDPAWIVVAPPSFAPMQKSVRTMWDLMRDVAIKASTLAKPQRPSFMGDIWPIFERMQNLQWVNAGFAAAFGWGGPFEMTRSGWAERLASKAENSHDLRHLLSNQFRVFDRDGYSRQPWPWLYGDAFDDPPAKTPRQHAALSDTQLQMLRQWADGDFDEDYLPNKAVPKRIEDAPLEMQPDLLTRGALEFCIADAFRPGCEMPWIVRCGSMYMAPFRFRHAPAGWVEPSFGAAFRVGAYEAGPLSMQVAGGITRWMAVPWHTDTASCRCGYQEKYDPYLPTFWPARAPNHVLTEANYRIVIDHQQPLTERMSAFAKRAAWLRPLGCGSYTEQLNAMITNYDALGVIEPRQGSDDLLFPSTMQVESLPVSATAPEIDHGPDSGANRD